MAKDGPNADDLYLELDLLRKNEGFTPRRLDRADVVSELLKGSQEDSYERQRSRFTSAIHSLDEDEAALLLDVFRLSPETDALSRLHQRRVLHGEKLGRSAATVADREPAALQRLVSRLVTGRYAQSPLVLDVPEMHNGIIYETTSTLIIVKDRRWIETREHYRFIATFDEMDYLTITRSYEATAYPDPAGDFKVNTRPVEGAGWNDHFWHLDAGRSGMEPMRRGEVYNLNFSLLPPATPHQQGPMLLASRAFHERALLASIKVAFIGEKSRDAWSFERVSAYARPGAPNASNAVIVDDRGLASLRLRDAHGGLYSGIAWNW